MPASTTPSSPPCSACRSPMPARSCTAPSRSCERPSMTDTLTRELAALDDALAGRPVDPGLTDLADLAVALRDDRPAPAPAFIRSLDERVERGFPRARKRRRGIKWPRLTLPALGVAASAALVVVVVALSVPDGGGSGAPSPAISGSPSTRQNP